jgi:hypothetical protein
MSVFPSQTNFVTGDILTATAVNEIGQAINLLESAQYAAAKNVVINGGMDIWQRSTSSSSLGNYFTADRWYQGAWSGAGTWAQESTVVPSGSRYSAKFTASATAQPYFITAIETMNAIQLAGKTVTLSLKFAASASATLNMSLGFSTTVDNGITGAYTLITPTSGGTVSASSTTFVTGTATFAVPSNAKTLRIILETSGTIASSAVIYIGQVQLEAASTASQFQRTGGSIQGELAACQRYYYRFTGIPTNFAIASMGNDASTTSAGQAALKLPVTMRTTPTALDTAGTWYYAVYAGGSVTLTGLTLNASTNADMGVISVTSAAAFNNAAKYQLLANNSTASYIGFSAEL